MQSFQSYMLEEQQLFETAEQLLEKLITFGGKAYPKFGNIVIMAGGAGSGKGFIKSNLIGLEGKVLDVDELKKLASKTPVIQQRVKKEMGIDLASLANDLKDPENVSKLHGIIGDYLKLDKRVNKALYRGIVAAPADRKPNIIFDVTLKDLQKLQNITRQVSQLGYDKKNIHIVWVINDIEVAKEQNLARDRVVPTEILINTHRGAANTMGDIINMGKSLQRYMDGDIVFAFNKVGVDATLQKNKGDEKQKIGMRGKTKGGSYIKDANYFYVKRKGKAPVSVKDLEADIKRKISAYVPKGVEWN